MALPPGLATVTITGTYQHPDGTPFTGRLTFRPEPAVLTSATHGTLILGDVETVLDAAGSFTVTLLATDDPDVTPTGWTYRVTERWLDAPGRTYPLSLPAAAPAVDIADIAPTAASVGEYTVITGPQGPAGATGATGPTGPAGVDGQTRGGVTLTTSGAPSDTLGIDDDWALDTGTRRLYGPKTAGAWPGFSVIPSPLEPGWTFNGFAERHAQDLHLTHAADGFGAGTIWYDTVQPTDGLDVTFEMEMSGGTGADGICFALADPTTLATFVGGGGGDLGLVGATATALALDTGAGSRARIVTTDATTMTAVATYGGALTLRPAPVTVRVRYADGALSAWIDGTQIFDAVTVTASATARIGWTGSNGGANDDHIIRSVQFVARGGIQL